MLSILIAARNAEATVDRAVASCIEEGAEIILIDDHCNDNTAAKANRIGGKKLRVIPTPGSGGLPIARQIGLDTVRTPFAAWLDADDEWLPGRADRLLKMLNHGFDVVTDSIDLHDGLTGKFLRRMEVPPFLRRHAIPMKLFERNYLPGDTQVGFRTQLFRDAGGYDPQVFGPESYDLLLRAIAMGATFAHLNESGYRMYAYPGSVSRNLSRIRSSTALALKKHSYETIYKLCRDNGFSHRISNWVIVSMATFREEYKTALEYLEHASPGTANPDTILEPDGPQPLPEGWRRAFFKGTLLLLLRRDSQEAADEMHRAEAFFPTAEGANNLGIAERRSGRIPEAMELFATALKRFPGYLDAKLNMIEKKIDHITSHPLRRHASRSEYCIENY